MFLKTHAQRGGRTLASTKVEKNVADPFLTNDRRLEDVEVALSQATNNGRREGMISGDKEERHILSI